MPCFDGDLKGRGTPRFLFFETSASFFNITSLLYLFIGMPFMDFSPEIVCTVFCVPYQGNSFKFFRECPF